jgi:hypothetical protein
MEWNWHAVVNVLWLIIVVGFVIWLFIRSFKKSESPGLLIFKWGLTLPIVIFLWRKIGPMIPEGGAQTIGGMLIATVCMVIIAILWRGSLIESVVKPFTAIFDGGNEPPEKKPYYSIAQAKRNRGKPHEAVTEIRKQLAQFPNDFEGVMLLARVQAEDMADLPGAENTLNHFCDRPEAPMKLVAAALTQLADWHIKIAADVDSARVALQKIVARFPDTETALQAEQRIAHLVETGKMILAQHDRQSIVVPEGVRNIGLLDSTEFLKPQEIDPGKLAAAHVKHLEAHPHDTEVREKLAVIYAKDFKRLDLATMELAQLINEPKHKPKQVAHWLNLLADFQIELGADVATVQTTLEKIVETFPDLPVAEIAQRRLARLKNEFRGRQQSSNVKLGVYEQNIGLKYGSPRKP